MRSKFPGYYRPTADALRNSWRHAIFVVDTNVLLNLYRLPVEAREQLLSALVKIRGQLWVPYLAALEFQRNRLSVIAEQKTKTGSVRAALDKVRTDATKEIEKLQLKKRHPSIDPEQIVGDISKSVNALIEQVEGVEGRLQTVGEEDPIRDRLDSIIGQSIGDGFSQFEIDSIQKEGEYRYGKNIPPGYMDRRKASDNDAEHFSYAGISYERVYSDLIIWKEILDRAKEDDCRAIIFITDDAKDDWIEKVKAEAPKTIGPRPELRDEIMRESNIDLFHIYNSEQFLTFARENLGVNVTDETVSEVERVLSKNRRKSIRNRARYGLREMEVEPLLTEAVCTWLETQYGIPVLYDEHPRIGDVVVQHPGTIGPSSELLIRQVPNSIPARQLRNWFLAAIAMVVRRAVERRLGLVLVVADYGEVDGILDLVGETREMGLVPEDLGIAIGIMGSGESGDWEFHEIYTNQMIPFV